MRITTTKNSRQLMGSALQHISLNCSLLATALLVSIGFQSHAKLQGAELSSGWKNGKIHVQLTKYVSSKNESAAKEQIEILSSSGVIYNSVEVSASSTTIVKNNINNPCQESSLRNLYKVIFEIEVEPDNAVQNYQVQWKSSGITQSFVSAQSLQNNPIKLMCHVPKDRSHEICTRQNAPPVVMCSNQSFPQELKTMIKTGTELSLQPSDIHFDISQDPLAQPSPNPPSQGLEGTTLKWNTGFSAKNPLGKDGYKINEVGNIEFQPNTPGNYIIQENLNIKNTKTILHSRVYIIEIVQ